MLRLRIYLGTGKTFTLSGATYKLSFFLWYLLVSIGIYWYMMLRLFVMAFNLMVAGSYSEADWFTSAMHLQCKKRAFD